ncbi:MAG: hypothetical protein LQ349_003087, partial [Xanthoria aureola]
SQSRIPILLLLAPFPSAQPEAILLKLPSMILRDLEVSNEEELVSLHLEYVRFKEAGIEERFWSLEKTVNEMSMVERELKDLMAQFTETGARLKSVEEMTDKVIEELGEDTKKMKENNRGSDLKIERLGERLAKLEEGSLSSGENPYFEGGG